MRLRLVELYESDKEASKIRVEFLNRYEKINGLQHHQGIPFVSKIILISCYNNNFLIEHFGINKTKDFVDRKYYWPSFQKDIEVYNKDCDIYLYSNSVKHKFYDDLQSLPIPTHQQKDFLIYFVTELLISTDWKRESYDSILVINDCLAKTVHYEPVKVIINALV